MALINIEIRPHKKENYLPTVCTYSVTRSEPHRREQETFVVSFSKSRYEDIFHRCRHGFVRTRQVYSDLVFTAHSVVFPYRECSENGKARLCRTI